MCTAQEKYATIKGHVYAIENDFFGRSINVSGLITGQDLIAQLRGKDLGERLLISNHMVRHDELDFLDDITLEQASAALGVPIYQGYGMTETSPIISVNKVGHNHPNTVGPALPNIEVRLGEGDELQVRGPTVMKGYWNREEATKAIFTEDGWLRTGDVCTIYPDGNIRITGRIKEIIVTSTGEKVPPADLEAAIETDPLFSQCYVIGENRPYLSLITVVNPDEWASFAKSCGVDPADPASLDNPSVKTAALKRAKTAAGEFPHYALPRAVVLTQEPWTIENGLITPTLKLKRGPLSKKFANVIAQLYATHG